MNTLTKVYLTNQAVVAGGATVTGPSVIFPPEKPGCVLAFIKYTLGTPGNTITVTLQVSTDGATWYDVSNNTEVITATKASLLSISGGPPMFRLKFASAGVGTDHIDVSISGLPVGTTVV